MNAILPMVAVAVVAIVYSPTFRPDTRWTGYEELRKETQARMEAKLAEMDAELCRDPVIRAKWEDSGRCKTEAVLRLLSKST